MPSPSQNVSHHADFCVWSLRHEEQFNPAFFIEQNSKRVAFKENIQNSGNDHES